MFEGWASDLLASYLGQFLDVQREKLRISLWSAWRTGLTLDNVSFRPDAFDHLQLPVKLTAGRIGRIQAHIPWQALRSPVVVELSDIHLSISPLSEEDLRQEPASQRAWAAKQVELAAAEAATLAANNPDAVGGKNSESSTEKQQQSDETKPESKQQGLMWALIQRVIGMVVNRLHFSVQNVHISYHDPISGRIFGFKLARMHTCTPGELEHASFLLGESAEVLQNASIASRRSMQKQVAVSGVELYWDPKTINNSNTNTTESEAHSDLGDIDLTQKGGAERHTLLGPLDSVLHFAVNLRGGVQAHVAAVIPSLPISLRPDQLTDICQFSDELQWLTLRTRYAALRPNIALQVPVVVGSSSVSHKPWREMWRFAINAVLADVQGPLHTAEWRPIEEKSMLLARYRELYERKLAREVAANKTKQELRDWQAPSTNDLTSFDATTINNTEEPESSASCIVDSDSDSTDDEVSGGSKARLSRYVTAKERFTAVASDDETDGDGIDTTEAHEEQDEEELDDAEKVLLVEEEVQELHQLHLKLCIHDILACRAAARRNLVTLAQMSNEESAGGGGEQQSSRSRPSSSGTSNPTINTKKKIIKQGLTAAAGFLRQNTRGKDDGNILLPTEPSESQVQELFAAVDFTPDTEDDEAAAADDGGPLTTTAIKGGVASGMQVSFHLLMSSIRVTLQEEKPSSALSNTSSRVAIDTDNPVLPHQQQQQQQPQQSPFDSAATIITPEIEPIAALEIHSLSIEVQSTAGGMIADVGMKDLIARDYVSQGSGVDVCLLQRQTLTPPPTSTTTTTTASSSISSSYESSPNSSSSASPRVEKRQTPLPSLPSIMKLRYATVGPSSTSATNAHVNGGASSKKPPPAATLDVLIQALQLNYSPACFSRLAAFSSSSSSSEEEGLYIRGTFAYRSKAAVGALSMVARARLKAEQLKQLGPPLDIALKVLDFSVVLDKENNNSSSSLRSPRNTVPPSKETSPELATTPMLPGEGPLASATLHTGPITVQSLSEPAVRAEAQRSAEALYAVLECIINTKRTAKMRASDVTASTVTGLGDADRFRSAQSFGQLDPGSHELQNEAYPQQQPATNQIPSNEGQLEEEEEQGYLDRKLVAAMTVVEEHLLYQALQISIPGLSAIAAPLSSSNSPSIKTTNLRNKSVDGSSSSVQRTLQASDRSADNDSSSMYFDAASVAGSAQSSEFTAAYSSLSTPFDPVMSTSGEGSTARQKSASVVRVLKPTHVDISLKLHRLSPDAGYPQSVCNIKVEPLVADVGLNLITFLSSFATTTNNQSTDAPVAVTSDNVAVQSSNNNSSSSTVVPIPFPSLILDVALSRVEVSLALPGCTAAYRLSLRSGAVNLKSYDFLGSATKINLSGVVLQDLTPLDSEHSLPPAIHHFSTHSLIPALARKIIAQAIHVSILPAGVADEASLATTTMSHTTVEGQLNIPKASTSLNSNSETHGVPSSTSPLVLSSSVMEIQLVDVEAEGFDNEDGNFITRLDERQPNHCTVILSDSMTNSSTVVSLSNAALGHGTLLRVLAAFVFDEVEDGKQQEQQAAVSSSAVIESTTVIDIRDCKLVWKYTPIPVQFAQRYEGNTIPAALHDLLSVHHDVTALEVSHLYVRLPLLEEEEVKVQEESVIEEETTAPPFTGQIDEDAVLCVLSIEDLTLSLATLGYPNHTTLPVLSLPQVSFHRTNNNNNNIKGRSNKQEYALVCGSIEAGIHPSHLLVAATALQLYAHEMEQLNRMNTGASGNKSEGAGTASIAQPALLQQQEQYIEGGGNMSDSNSNQRSSSNSCVHITGAIEGLGISVLGSTHSSSCLKLEWRNISVNYLSSSHQAASLHPDEESSPLIDAKTRTEVKLDFTAMEAYCLRRKASPSFEFTPFTATGGGGGGSHGFDYMPPGSPDGDWLVPMHARDTYAPGSGGGGGGNARRSLSDRLGLAGAAPGPAPITTASTTTSNVRPAAGAIGVGGSGSVQSYEAGMPYLMQRFHASSIVSRYYSIAGSDFDDATSDLFEGSKSPLASAAKGRTAGGGALGSSSPKQRALPLQTASEEFEVGQLLSLRFSTLSSSSSATTNTQEESSNPPLIEPSVVTDTDTSGSGSGVDIGMSEHETHAMIFPLALRVYMHGWEGAAECSNTYTAFYEQARGQFTSGWLAAFGGPNSSSNSVPQSSTTIGTGMMAATAAGPLHVIKPTNTVLATGQQQQQQQQFEGLASAMPAGAEGTNSGIETELVGENSNRDNSVLENELTVAVSPAINSNDDTVVSALNTIRITILSFTIEAVAASGMLHDQSLDTDDAIANETSSNASASSHHGNTIKAVPVGILSISSEIESTTNQESGDTEISVLLSSALCSAGLCFAFKPHDAMELLPIDALLGICNTKAVLQQVVSSKPEQSVAVNAQQVSVWVNQRNAAVAAALAQHAQHMATSLELMTGGSCDYDVTGIGTGGESKDVQSSSAKATSLPSTLVVSLHLDTFAAVLSLDNPPIHATHNKNNNNNSGGRLYHVTTPLLELSASDLTVLARSSTPTHNSGSDWLTGSLALKLQLDVFNGNKLAWEPVLEPWQASTDFVLPFNATESGTTTSMVSTAAGLSKASTESNSNSSNVDELQQQHLKVALSAKQGLEITLSESAVEALTLASQAATTLSSITAEPDLLVERLAAAAATEAPHTTAFRMRNVTGMAVEVWLEAAGDDGSIPLRSPLGPATLTVPSGSTVVLPVLPEHAYCPVSQRSGFPCSTRGIILPFDDRGEQQTNNTAGAEIRSDDTNASKSSSATSVSAPNLALHSRHLNRKTLLYFRLSSGQGPLTGPVHVDRRGSSVHTVGLGQIGMPAVHARVVCETVAATRGGFTISMHSGVQVRNTTAVELELGLQTPMGLITDPLSLATLPPGGSAWIPVSRIDTALLCVRPTAGQRAVAKPPSLNLRRQLMQAGLSGPGPSTSGGGGGGVLYASRQLSPQRSAAELKDPRAFEWSNTVPLVSLLASSGTSAVQLQCTAVHEEQPAMLVCMGAIHSGDKTTTTINNKNIADSSLQEVLLSPPLKVHNVLPVPIDLTLTTWSTVTQRLHLQPNGSALLHDIEAAGVEHITVKAAGFHVTDPICPPSIPHQPAVPSTLNGHSTSSSTSTVLREVWAVPDVKVVLHETGVGRSTVEVMVRHSMDPATGCHVLHLTCALWLYNCTGIPVSLRPSIDDAALIFDSTPEHELYPEDLVPDVWVPPLALLGQNWHLSSQNTAPSPALTSRSRFTPRPGAGAGTTPLHTSRELSLATPLMLLSPAGGPHTSRTSVTFAGDGLHMTPRTAPAPGGGAGLSRSLGSFTSLNQRLSSLDVSGLGEILDSGNTSNTTPDSTVGRGNMTGMLRTTSRARGIADSMETTPAFEMPSRWPSMYSGVHARHHRLRLQLRITQSKASAGDKPYWSDPIELDSAGGVAVASLPAPPPAAPGSSSSATTPAATLLAQRRSAYPVTLTSGPVPGCDGATALCVLPRYVLRNTLEVPMQYKQYDTMQERELEPGGTRAVRWADVSRPHQLCVRVQEAGWLWSGAFSPDAPGDLFVKIRHRDRGITVLVRVDVAVTSSGVILVTLSHQPSGFAPYRIENCTLETLHARQYRVREQQDVLRPYCALNYAWDEPAQPHKLVIELPGARQLGTFDLDKVGQDIMLTIKTPRRTQPEVKLRVLVRAEGPTRVLTVVDTTRHAVPAASSALSSSLFSLDLLRRNTTASALPSVKKRGWFSSTSGGKNETSSITTSSKSSASVATGMQWEVSLDLSSFGLSLVAATEELVYSRISSIRTRLASTSARYTFSLEVGAFQIDNPSPLVAFPVILALPAPTSGLRSTVKAATQRSASSSSEALPAPSSSSTSITKTNLASSSSTSSSSSITITTSGNKGTPASSLVNGSGVAASSSSSTSFNSPGLLIEFEVWQRRPAGVLCAEHIAVQVPSLALFIEQAQAMELGKQLSALLAASERASMAPIPSLPYNQQQQQQPTASTVAGIGPLTTAPPQQQQQQNQGRTSGSLPGVDGFVTATPSPAGSTAPHHLAAVRQDGTTTTATNTNFTGVDDGSVSYTHIPVTSGIGISEILVDMGVPSIAASERVGPGPGGSGMNVASSIGTASEENGTVGAGYRTVMTTGAATTPKLGGGSVQMHASSSHDDPLVMGGGGATDLPQLQALLLELGGGGFGTNNTLGANAAAAAGGGVQTASSNTSTQRSQKIFMDLFTLSPVALTVSFLPEPYHPDPRYHRLAALQRLLSLADVEDAVLRLSGLTLKSPLMDQSALLQQLQRHYTRALLQELYKVVGSASVFGDPLRLVQHLGLGVWAFLASPAAGLVESARERGPRQFLLGVLGGTQGLLRNVIFAVSNAATKATIAARKAIVVMGLDRPMPSSSTSAADAMTVRGLGNATLRRRVHWQEPSSSQVLSPRIPQSSSSTNPHISASGGGSVTSDGLLISSSNRWRAQKKKNKETGSGLLAALLKGAIGLVIEPVRGLDEDGLKGLLQGLQRGALGVIVLPLAAALEMCAKLADSIRRAVAGSNNLGWIRPPRYVTATQPLRPYMFSQAMGRWLLTELERMEAESSHEYDYHGSMMDRGLGRGSVYSSERFVLCVPTVAPGCYVVVTGARVMYVKAKGLVWRPEVMWQASIVDLELAASALAGAPNARDTSNPVTLPEHVTEEGHEEENNAESQQGKEGPPSSLPSQQYNELHGGVGSTENGDTKSLTAGPLTATTPSPVRHLKYGVQFVAQQGQRAIRPVTALGSLSGSGASRSGGAGDQRSYSPFSFLLVHCTSQDEADELVIAVKGLMNDSVKGCTFIGKTQCIFRVAPF